ncbi:MAG: hypothetical protein ACAH35_04270 [Candidatus Paceibacterota bacterium]
MDIFLKDAPVDRRSKHPMEFCGRSRTRPHVCTTLQVIGKDAVDRAKRCVALSLREVPQQKAFGLPYLDETKEYQSSDPANLTKLQFLIASPEYVQNRRGVKIHGYVCYEGRTIPAHVHITPTRQTLMF